MTTGSKTQIKDERIISEEVKSKLLDLGSIVLQGALMATGGLIVNSLADSYKNSQQKKLVTSDLNILEFDQVVNS